MFDGNEHDTRANALIDGVVSALSDVVELTLPDAPAHGSGAAPTALVVRGASGRSTLPIAVRLGRLDRQLATALDLPRERPLLLVAPYVSDAVGEVLRARGVDYADAVGNVRLTQAGLHIDIRGRSSRARTTRTLDRTAARAFTRSGCKVTFALLSWPELAGRPVREVAAAGGVAVGTAHEVLHDLTAAGYLMPGSNGRTLNRGAELLGRWAEAFTVSMARTLKVASFMLPERDQLGRLEADLLGTGAQLGGERAAARIDPYLHSATATFYVDDLPADLVARYRLRPDAAGAVQVRRRFWHHPDEAELVPTPLIYADLISSGDPRQREHAERIRAVDPRLIQLDRT